MVKTGNSSSTHANGAVYEADGIGGCQAIGQGCANVEAVKEGQLVALGFQVMQEGVVAVLQEEEGGEEEQRMGGEETHLESHNHLLAPGGHGCHAQDMVVLHLHLGEGGCR